MTKSLLPEWAAVLLCYLAGALAAAAVMLLPVWRIEALVGAIGLAELFSPARAPLGDTARLLLALAGGVLAMALAALALMAAGQRFARRALPKAGGEEELAPWQDEPDDDFIGLPLAGSTTEPASRPGDDGADDYGIEGPYETHRRGALSRLMQGRSPAESERFDATDAAPVIPQLRSGDRHPDAPPRAPIIASVELGEPISASPSGQPPREPAPEEPASAALAQALVSQRPDPGARAVGLTDLIHRFENGVRAREELRSLRQEPQAAPTSPLAATALRGDADDADDAGVVEQGPANPLIGRRRRSLVSSSSDDTPA